MGVRTAAKKGSMDDIKDQIIKLCNDLGGSKNKELMKILKEHTPSGNPNSLKSVEKLEKCLEAVKKVKPIEK